MTSPADTQTPGNRHQKFRPPVFILAPPRSYSTVTLAIMAGHPDLFGFPEMLIFDAPTVGSLLNEQQRRPWARPEWIDVHLSGVIRATAELNWGGQSVADIRRARCWLGERPDWTTVELMNYFLELINPLIGLEKSPETVYFAEALDSCLQAYPEARFLHLTRHPLTSQRSMHAHWRLQPGLAGQALITRAASTWYYGHSRVVTWLAQLPDIQWMRVRAEDVLSAPRSLLPRILGWLGLPASDQIIGRMLRTEDWRFAGTGESDTLFGGDQSFYRSPRLRHIPEPGPVMFDPAWKLPGDMCAQIGDLARHLGY
jgi:hypothetical protein